MSNIENITQGTTYSTIQDAINDANPNDIIELGAGSFGEEGAAGDPIVIDVAGLTIRGAFHGTSATDSSRSSNGVVADKGNADRTSDSNVVGTTSESEINDPIEITAEGVTIDGVTFDVTANFLPGGDNELSGGGIVVDYGDGTTITNSRFIETAGSDVGPFNQRDLATSQDEIHDLEISNNAFFGGNPEVQIGNGAALTGTINVTFNDVDDGGIYITPGLGSTADITVEDNDISGSSPFGDFPFGINGAAFAADEVPATVLANLNDVASDNTIDSGTLTFAGSEGDDDLTSFASNDSLQYFVAGDEGNDTLAGAASDDTLLGGGGDDSLSGGTGDDSLDGDGNFAGQTGMAGNDTIAGGDGNDMIDGGDGSDFIRGDGPEAGSNAGDGADEIHAGGGNDTVGGNGGDDIINGEEGNDRLFGADGSDTITGGTGNDFLNGGNDTDSFVFSAGDGDDIITDFEDGSEQIEFTGISMMDVTILGAGSDTLIEYSASDSILLQGIDSSDININDDFIFA